MRKFRKIQHNLQNVINNEIEKLLENTEFNSEGINGFIADVERGRARFSTLQFTVPLWVYNKNAPFLFMKEEGYFTYYVAHELSHVLSYKKYNLNGKGHGENFYKIFKIVCPKEYQHFELHYKPSSKKYGINKKIN